MTRPNPTQPKPQAPAYWEGVEYLRRLERIIRETSIAETSAKIGISRATIYRWVWGERSPSLENLRAIGTAYPSIFPEFSILKEDSPE